MYNYSAEYLAAVVIFLLLSFFYKKDKKISHTQRHYLFGLVTNLVCIGTDLVAGYINEIHGCVALKYLCNTAYYISCFGMITIYTEYAIERVLSHVDIADLEEHVHALAKYSMSLMTLVIAANIPMGYLFYFNQETEYCQGKLWYLGYFYLSALLIILMGCYLKFYKKIDKEGRQMMMVGVPVLALLVICQVLYPNLLLNGMQGAFLAVLFFLCFESFSSDSDSVTKLGNLGAFFTELDHCMLREQATQLILISLRNFSSINVAYGFEQGNEILYRISEWLEKEFSQGKCFRFGPADFMVLLPYRSEEQADDMLKQVRENFPESIAMQQTRYIMKPNYINMICTDFAMKANEIISSLEYGRRIAKEQEYDCLTVNDQMLSERIQKMKIADYLQECVEKEAFEMWYQPIYCTRSKRFCSAEALMRLKDKNGNFISPELFVPIAEELGLIARISDISHAQVARMLAANPRLPVSTISLNLSMQQLQNSFGIEYLQDILRSAGISKDKLSFEITERMLISKDKNIQNTIKRMQKENARFLLDDFGIGYSNFASVMEFPFEKIKMDKSLINSNNDKAYFTVKTLVQLFHETGKKVVVEGVETEEQASHLIDIGVDYLQGYYYAKPMSQQDYIAFLYEKNR